MDKKYLKINNVKSTELVTSSLYKFEKERWEIFNYFIFQVNLVSKADETATRAAKALLPFAKTEEEKTKYENAMDNPNRNMKIYQKQSSRNSKLLVIQCYDNYLNYLTGIFRQIVNKRPEVLASRDQISYESVLSFKSLKELRKFIVDRKIHELSYGGISAIEKYYIDRFGIKVFENDEHRNNIRLLIEIRNIFVHNGGKVNEIFQKRLNNIDYTRFLHGKYKNFVHVDFDEFILMQNACLLSATGIDNCAAEKFSIQRKRYKTWCK
jgi:hypothetical protein